jgi:Ca2+-binding EF-hand superfamily protein
MAQRQELNDQELLELFNIVDVDHSGSIDRDELVSLLLKIGFSNETNEVEAIVNSIDKDGNGFDILLF